MSRKPVVAMVTFGTASSLWLARALSSHADVHLFLPSGVVRSQGAEAGPDVELRPFRWPRFYRALTQAREMRAVVAEIRALRPDVVHVHQGHHMLNLLLGRLGELPLVVTAHEPSLRGRARHVRRRPPERLAGLAFRRADRVIVYADALRDELARRGVARDAIHVVPRAMPQPVGETATLDGGPTVLLFGRAFPYKGVEQLIRATPAVARAVPELSVVIAGEGPDHRRYRRLAGDAPWFRFEQRFVPVHERDELFRQASVVVLPYLDAATSAVIPVAQLFAKPVVATDVGGLAEQVEGFGMVVPPLDRTALVEALVRLLGDPPLRRRLGAAGRARLEAESAPEAVVPRTLAVYGLAGRAYT